MTTKTLWAVLLLPVRLLTSPQVGSVGLLYYYGFMVKHRWDRPERKNPKYPVWYCKHGDTHHQRSGLEVAVGLFYFQRDGRRKQKEAPPQEEEGTILKIMCQLSIQWRCRRINNHMGNERNCRDSVLSECVLVMKWVCEVKADRAKIRFHLHHQRDNSHHHCFTFNISGASVVTHPSLFQEHEMQDSFP